MNPEATHRLLDRLRQLEGSPESWWDTWSRDEWPTLFALLQVAADLPLFADNNTLSSPPADLWPEMAQVASDIGRLQQLIQTPTVPKTARLMDSLPAHSPSAAQELRDSHCVTVHDLLDAEARHRLDGAVDALRPSKQDSWGALSRQDGPEVFEIFDAALANPAFASLTGYQAERDTYTLTLSLQSLQASGIGWHQDLYWPKEWIGEDVFAVLYGLGDDDAERGGAFVYYEPWRHEIRAVYRKRHHATVLWNASQPEGRLLHGVSGYHTDDTSRHLIILQCLRRADDRS